ncbi:MAG: ABC transporter substrate-binding protein [Candidatus Rokubacteria bacterium]|nr:ABC transporter substrate-binding protein [Candidatus Rokubacteria bacterium]
MTRRRLLALSAALLVAPPAAAAQQKVYRIGVLSIAAPEDPANPKALEAFRQGLQEHGWVEGQNVTIEHRWARGKPDVLAELAADLVRSKVDVILAAGGPAAPAAKKATSTIPIVFSAVLDPVAAGLVSSLARPGGNVTGVSFFAGPEIAGKALQLLKEAVPTVARMAVLWNPANVQHALFLKEAEVAARALGLGLRALAARDADALDQAFATMSREHAGALVVLADAMSYVHRTRIADLAAKHRLPAIYGQKEHVEAGGLIAYGPGFVDRYRRAGIYVGKILKGSKPADLPVEQPTKFELIINLKTARALGLTIPPSLLLRADQVIE